MNLSIPVYVIHHDPSIWPEPETFQPERFLKEEGSSIKPCSWLPFGGGPRQCIGAGSYHLQPVCQWCAYQCVCEVSIYYLRNNMLQVNGLLWLR